MPRIKRTRPEKLKTRVLYLTAPPHRELLVKVARYFNCSNSMAVALSFEYVAGIRSATGEREFKTLKASPMARIAIFYRADQAKALDARLKTEGLGYSEFGKRVIEEMFRTVATEQVDFRHPALRQYMEKQLKILRSQKISSLEVSDRRKPDLPLAQIILNRH